MPDRKEGSSFLDIRLDLQGERPTLMEEVELIEAGPSKTMQIDSPLKGELR